MVFRNADLANVVRDLLLSFERRRLVADVVVREGGLDAVEHSIGRHHELSQQLRRNTSVALRVGIEVVVDSCESIVQTLLVRHLRQRSLTVEHDDHIETNRFEIEHPSKINKNNV
jgi:hypothetical protein